MSGNEAPGSDVTAEMLAAGSAVMRFSVYSEAWDEIGEEATYKVVREVYLAMEQLRQKMR